MPKETRTYKDRAEYLKKAVTKRRRKLKQMAVDHKGGKCELCGYSRHVGSLEFHHKNPTQKDFSLSVRGLTRSWQRIKKEINKCILVCSNCHKEIHGGFSQLSAERWIEKPGEFREA